MFVVLVLLHLLVSFDYEKNHSIVSENLGFSRSLTFSKGVIVGKKFRMRLFVLYLRLDKALRKHPHRPPFILTAISVV